MKLKFEKMTRLELRKYIVEHREDEEAFQVYMDKVMTEPGEVYPAPQSIEDLQHFPQLIEKRRQEKLQ